MLIKYHVVKIVMVARLVNITGILLKSSVSKSSMVFSTAI